MDASILMDHRPSRSQPGVHRIRVLLQIRGQAPTAHVRTPLNLSVVLDTSGSMHGHKLAYAQRAARQVFGGVFPEDVTSLVSFSDEARVLAEAGPAREQRGIERLIGRMAADGCTNLSDGWLQARLQLESFRAPERANRILLMTDGQANLGIIDPAQLIRLVAQARTQRITTSTVGFGADFDEQLLTALADAGGGNAHYIEHPDQAPDVFASELDELLGMCAQNLTVRLRLASGVRLTKVRHTYPREDGASGPKFRLGDLYTRDPKELLLEFSVRPEQDRAVRVAMFDVRADVLRREGGIERRRMELPVTFSPADGPSVDAVVQRTVVYLRAAAERTQALEEERRGLYQQAATRLRTTALYVREVADERSGEEAADLELLARRLEAGQFADADRKYASDRAYRASRSKTSTMDLLSRTRRE